MNLVEKLITETRWRRKLIVVIGDVMVDRWIHGHREQSQDGCHKFIQERTIETPGGAANALQSLKYWSGIRTELYGYAQNDCPIKTRYVEGNNIVFRADDDGPKTRGDGYNWARKQALEMVPFADGVLISDYDKGFMTTDFIREVVSLCRRRGIPCVADTKRPPETYVGATLKCNSDYQHMYNDYLSTECSDRWVLTTGALNPIVWEQSEPIGLGYDLPPVRCLNHVGAGDCFAAHLTLALSCKFSLKEAAAVAHSAGRVYVQFEHNRPPDPVAISADLSSAR